MEEKANIVIQLKEFLASNYSLGRRNGDTTTIDGKMLDEITFNSIYVTCKEHFPKTKKYLLKAILNSDFIDDYINGMYE